MSITPPKNTSEDAHTKTSNDEEPANYSNEDFTAHHTPLTTGRTSHGLSLSKPMRKPANSERPQSPSSTYSLPDAKHNHTGNWLQVFLRTVFVDWVGGFVCWLCGRGKDPV
jgi:hypothetical protein